MIGIEMVIIANTDPKKHKFNDILIDDGSGRKINIPVAIIDIEDAKWINTVLDSKKEDEKEIWASVDFTFSRTIKNGDVTELGLWISAGQ